MSKVLWMNRIRLLAMLVPGVIFSGCGRTPEVEAERVIHMATASQVKTLDPALAEDLASRNMAGALFDTLLQYHYTHRPYELQPSMLACMPESVDGGATYRFTLRDDLYFAHDVCFGVDGGSAEQRKVRASDVVFSFLRIADARLHSPVFWLWRNQVKGADVFFRKTAELSDVEPEHYFDVYDTPVEGFEVVDELHFNIHLNRPNPRFLYNLAIPYTGILSEKAVRYYGNGTCAEHPVGSGPFVLGEYLKNYRIILQKNPDFRTEYLPEAENAADRTKKLPLADRIECVNVRQGISAWLLFLQGELELSALNKDNADMVTGGRELLPVMKDFQISLVTNPEFEIQYIGFSFSDPRLANNLKLRQALALAYDVPQRIRYANDLALPLQGPIPPGVAGYEEIPDAEQLKFDLAQAEKLLAEAGYPNGIDPATGEPLELEFDQSGNTGRHRQHGEMTAGNWGKLGIKVKVNLNNSARFYQKLRQGKVQTFRLSWVGDYPDAENFLQLFYSKNIGGCNRAAFHDEEFDRMFEQILPMADSPERTELYRKMARYVIAKQPWIFESQPVSLQLKHAWLQNYYAHDFAFNRWKYWSVDPKLKAELRRKFRPLTMEELQGKSGK